MLTTIMIGNVFFFFLRKIMIGNVNMLMFDFIANLIKICGNIRSLCLVYFLKKKKFTKCGTTGR